MRHYTRSRLIPLVFAAGMLVMGCKPGAESTTSSGESPAPGKPKSATSGKGAPAKPSGREFDDVARFIAGLPPTDGSPLTELSTRPAWTKYAASFDKNWTKLDTTRMVPMRKWAAEELAGKAQQKTLFYPFSGPDYLHAATFFPGADSYVLVALEPVGAVPDVQHMAPDAMDQFFASVDRSLESVLSFSFFKTDNMKVDLKKDIEGTVPILMIFLARTGNHIDDIAQVAINDAGDVVTAEAGAKLIKGVDVTFTGPGGAGRHLLYFSANIHNDYLKRSSAFMNYVTKLGPVDTYIKSASYLMHKDYFSTIRDGILDHSALVVQDDSGIPYRFFKPAKWDIALYGVYASPIEMFKEHKEDDLAKAYKAVKTSPLPFGIGYNWRPGNSNLLVAKSKSEAATGN